LYEVNVMASGWTNRGKDKMLDWVFRAATIPTNFYLALVTSAVAPTAASTVFSALTEIATGNGYTTGGYQLARNATDFDTLTEAATTLIQLKDITWTASTGNMPGSGGGARYAVLLDDNATIASRLVLAYWDLSSSRVEAVGQPLTLLNVELDLT
jgi:hypothetical protein